MIIEDSILALARDLASDEIKRHNLASAMWELVCQARREEREACARIALAELRRDVVTAQAGGKVMLVERIAKLIREGHRVPAGTSSPDDPREAA